MNAKSFLIVVCILLLSNIGSAQTYNPKNNLYAEDFLSEKFDLKFPKDHNAHKDFKTEWWYITANLKNTKGDLFGIQWTLFRNKSDLNHFKCISSPCRWGKNELHNLP